MSLAVIAPIAAVLLVVIDQLLKRWATAALAKGSITLISGVFSLTYHENFGAAFGIMQNRRPILIAATVIIMAGAIWLICSGRIKGRLLTWSVTLIVAGGVGNLIDRVANGYVVDYIYFELINFPIFNFADSCVVVGTCLMILYVLVDERQKGRKELKQ